MLEYLKDQFTDIISNLNKIEEIINNLKKEIKRYDEISKIEYEFSKSNYINPHYEIDYRDLMYLTYNYKKGNEKLENNQLTPNIENSKEKTTFYKYLKILGLNTTSFKIKNIYKKLEKEIEEFNNSSNLKEENKLYLTTILEDFNITKYEEIHSLEELEVFETNLKTGNNTEDNNTEDNNTEDNNTEDNNTEDNNEENLND